MAKYNGDFVLNKRVQLLTREVCHGRDLGVVRKVAHVSGSGTACGQCVVVHSEALGNALTREQIEKYLGHKLNTRGIRTMERSVAVLDPKLLSFIHSFEAATNVRVYRVWLFWSYKEGKHLEYIAVQSYDGDQVYLSRKLEADCLWHGGSTFTTEQFNKLRKAYTKVEEEAK